MKSSPIFHNLDDQNRRFETAHPLEILKWVYQHQARIDIGTSLGPAGIVILHLVKSLKITPKVFMLDTEFLFPQTLMLKTQIEDHLNLKIQTITSSLSVQDQANLYGSDLWTNNPDLCCTLRKVEPLQSHLLHLDAWINGVRRQQGQQRSQTPILSHIQTQSGHTVLKVSPLATWSRKQVWTYIHKHDLPYNTLHDQGYPSIGCTHCTQAVHTLESDEQERQGRWGNSIKKECGIHTFHKGA